MADKGLTYRDAGVDIDEGDALVERIKPHARRTARPEVLAGIGGFGGLFEVPKGYREPVMVVGTDGVGTKLKLAFMAGKHDTVGIDLVAMSVNDVVVCGAEPVVFLDYFATSRLDAAEAEQVIKGIAEGCLRAGCALIGGETAELPGFYARGEYDLAGFCVGVVEKSRILDGSRVKASDVVVGMASSGLHSNGFSLARKVFDGNIAPDLARELLEPTRIYVKECLALRDAVEVKAFAHITGGGLPGNLPRVLPDGHRAALRRAEAAGVPAMLLPYLIVASREEYDRQVVAALQKHSVDVVCLAGFMRLITPVLLGAFERRILNIHPSLLPAFPGLHAVRQALAGGVRVSGCTVHVVDEGTDTGPIVIQAAVPVLDGDTEDTLAARILVQEHRCYPRAIALWAQGRVRIEGGRVRIAGAPGRPDRTIASPELSD